MDLRSDAMVAGRTIRVFGLVQGVGFRPFLHRIATRESITGEVRNRNDCVEISVDGFPDSLLRFTDAISTEAPPLAEVTRVVVRTTAPHGFRSFAIVSSESDSQAVTRVSPDTAVCEACLADMRSDPRRLRYPFTNCTNCGPRFSIIRELPYDRPLTTMAVFDLCEACAREYHDIDDRRYHAQPNACLACGPHYQLLLSNKAPAPEGDPIESAAAIIDGGGIVAIKGIGGFHLAVAASNAAVVERLRAGKRREGKPFAVMCRDLSVVRTIASLSEPEERLLTSFRAPIVLLDRRRDDRNPSPPIAEPVASGLDTIGVMLPYAPVHHMLFASLASDVIVMTSGNRSNEPIAISTDQAVETLGPITDAVLTHNRAIHNRIDDSVATVSLGATILLRRARGWVPGPIELDLAVEGIAATGGELKSTFALGKGNEAILSQHIGDLKNPDTMAFYEESFSRLSALFRFAPTSVACDLHPDYLSTRFAASLGVPTVQVQHHHAHIVAVLADHHRTDRVIGVAFDGTGYGTDGHIWGGEILIADRCDFSRFAHLDYLPLPGGDRAIGEPWRIAFAMLLASHHDRLERYASLPVFAARSEAELKLVATMISRRVSTPLSSGAGRVFDGIAALAGFADIATYEAEGPMLLEAALPGGWERQRPYQFAWRAPKKATRGPHRIDWRPVVRQTLEDLENRVPASTISARFHRGLAEIVVTGCLRAREHEGISTVALGGGVFQNRRLLSLVSKLLSEHDFEVLLAKRVPANDGGLCLGQLACAAERKRRR